MNGVDPASGLAPSAWNSQARAPNRGVLSQYSALREIIGRFVEGILSIVTLLLSLILMLTSKERKSLHDLIAGTVVPRDPNKALTARKQVRAVC